MTISYGKALSDIAFYRASLIKSHGGGYHPTPPTDGNVASLQDQPTLLAFDTVEELVVAFTNEDGVPKVYHGMGTMLGVFPAGDEQVHWFSWLGDGFQHAFSTSDFPPDAERLELRS